MNVVKPCSIQIASASQVPLVLSTLLDVCLSSLAAININQSLLIDLMREAGQLAQQVYDHLFFAPLAVTNTRLRAAGRVCAALSELAISVGLPDVAEPYWARFLMCRLEAGPDSVWAKVDSGLAVALRSSEMHPRNMDVFHSVVRCLQEEEWGEDGDSLRV